MIPAPHTYSEWVSVLDIFKAKSNDSEVLTAMKNGTVEWQSGVAERFSKRLIDSVNYRMNTASDKFQKEMSRAYGSEGAIVQALLALRKEMSFLVQAIDLPALPEKTANSIFGLCSIRRITCRRHWRIPPKKTEAANCLA